MKFEFAALVLFFRFCLLGAIEVNLNCIRFSFVFLRFCFSMKKYALFRRYFYKSISALSRLLHVDENFVYFRTELFVSLYKRFVRKTFVQYVTVWFVCIWTHCIKIRIKKNILFHEEEKTYKNEPKRTQADKKRILCKSTLKRNENKFGALNDNFVLSINTI